MAGRHAVELAGAVRPPHLQGFWTGAGASTCAGGWRLDVVARSSSFGRWVAVLGGRLNLDLRLDQPLETLFCFTSSIFALDDHIHHPLEMLLGRPFRYQSNTDEHSASCFDFFCLPLSITMLRPGRRMILLACCALGGFLIFRGTSNPSSRINLD
jgi:hypothetical protein